MCKFVDQSLHVKLQQKENAASPLVIANAVRRFFIQLAMQGKQKCARVLVLLAFALGAAGTANAEELNFSVFNDLTTLVHLSENFLDDVETAANTGAANRLSKFLLETTVVELRIRIVKNGFDKISRPTSKLVALQKTLLNVRASGGQFKAAAAARKLRIRAKLEAYRKELVALPCSDVHGSWRLPGQSFSDALVSTKTASIGGVLVLILGVFAFLLFDRLQKRTSGKKKRFVCRADCKIQINEDEEATEAQIVDISRIGAKVKTESACPVGSEIEVVLPKKRVMFPNETVTIDSWSFVGKIMWSKGDYMGLEFKELMEQDRMDQLISAS